jgi:hypothetical protein
MPTEQFLIIMEDGRGDTKSENYNRNDWQYSLRNF